MPKFQGFSSKYLRAKEVETVFGDGGSKWTDATPVGFRYRGGDHWFAVADRWPWRLGYFDAYLDDHLHQPPDFDHEQGNAKWRYDSTAGEWVLYTKDSGGAYVPRIRVKAGQDDVTVALSNGLRLGNSGDAVAGTLRWTGTALQYYDGTQWKTVATV